MLGILEAQNFSIRVSPAHILGNCILSPSGGKCPFSKLKVPSEKVKREKEGLELAGFWQWGTSPGKGRVASRSLSSKKGDKKEERTNVNLQNLKLTLEKGKAGIDQGITKGARRSHILTPSASMSPVQRDAPSFVALEGPVTQPSKETVLRWRCEQRPWILVQALLLLISRWVFLSLSLASFSSDSFVTRITWRLKYGVVLNFKTQRLQGWEDESSDVSV